MFKGNYDSGTDYSVGDVVIFDDGERAVYTMQHNAPPGQPPTNSLYWGRVGQPLSECILNMQDALDQIPAVIETVAAEAVAEALGQYFVDDKTLILASSTEDSDKKFAITVDDEGDIGAAEVVEETPGEDTPGEGGES